MSSPTPKAPATAPNAAAKTPAAPSHFIRQVIEQDLEKGTYAQRRASAWCLAAA